MDGPEDPENSLEYELMWIFIFITVALIPFCICWSLRIEVFGNCSGSQEGQQNPQRTGSSWPQDRQSRTNFQGDQARGGRRMERKIQR